ncbi:N-acetylmuramoyl-L-alanine amidase [Silvibacterium acidisoli]|uniref:N-acetylmuramoyl-L-alanine amidase n=1 Tax=Acidobacteriaceae bacterium ZG23-2 TaxID=2883246 RepID=UPI00406C5E70
MRTPFEKAQRMREALEGRPEKQRTRRDYERTMDAYRAVYHSDPRSGKADDAVAAVADLLAEEGRLFEDEKSLHDAIGQYDFLRKEYPGSKLRFSALLTTGEIYLRDLNDRDNARATFQQFLKLYPQNPLANSARAELANLKKPIGHGRHQNNLSAQTTVAPETDRTTQQPTPAERRKTVLDAAIQSQQAEKTGKTTAKPSRQIETAPEQTRTESDVPPPPVQAAPPEPSHLSEAALNATPPPRRGKQPLVTGVRHWSTSVYTRVAIDLQDEVRYEATRVTGPDRIFFDLHGTRLSPELIGKSDEVIDDGFLKRIRVAQFSNDVTRVVLDVSDVSEYSAFFLPNPYRLIIDVHGSKSRPHPASVAATTPPPVPAKAAPVPAPAKSQQPANVGIGSSTASVNELGAPLPKTAPPATTATIRSGRQPHVGSPASDAEKPATADPSALADVATLSQQPNRVKATRRPTTAPVVESVAGTTQAPQPNELASVTPPPFPATTRNRPARPTNSTDAVMPEIRAAQPTADGQRSMVRALGLKINRIVVDAGHGGHDSGTLGPDGIEEKDVVLDVALRLGKLLKERLGADVIYTRDDDTFIPLETRTAIANKAQADLFISVHANSSSDASARGVETYYLNFTTSADALEVAARENAVSDQSIHQLSDLVKKITLQDKINESREFASDVEQSLYTGLEDGNPGLKDRGVKKAPFVVLIGANMPSILAEISFLTNPNDAHQLREGAYRERIAESLYHGVARYVGSLSGTRVADASHGSR